MKIVIDGQWARGEARSHRFSFEKIGHEIMKSVSTLGYKLSTFSNQVPKPMDSYQR
jgi:hypothetical protein